MEKKAIRVAYGEAIVKLAEKNDKVVVLDADLAAATMTNGFKKAYPDLPYDSYVKTSKVAGSLKIAV